MAHFAKVENGTVTEVIVVKNCAIGGCVSPDSPDYNPNDHLDCGNLDFPETESIGRKFIKDIGLDGEWFQCSYSGSFRGAFPGPQHVYDRVTETFYLPEWMIPTRPEIQATE